MSKKTKALSGAAQDAYFRRLLKAHPNLSAEERDRLVRQLRREIALLRVRPGVPRQEVELPGHIAAPANAAGGQNAPGPGGGPPGTGPAIDNTLLEHIGPYPIRTSRERVTMEDAPVTFPNPRLALLQAPNKITAADFEGWIQERGLNFPDQWDPRYQSVLESHDTGEMPLPGGMLYTKYGKGAYVFSAYDWFRELPAGVPGAYRMFANMLSAAKTQ